MTPGHLHVRKPPSATVAVCICTYKRPDLLRRTLDAVAAQDTRGVLSCSIVVADNDAAKSAEWTVRTWSSTHAIPVTYVVEPEANIALARNAAVSHATGDFIAFVDDDELPSPEWLHALWQTCQQPGVAGVLGPVRPHFDEAPPPWLVQARLCERPEHRTGTLLHWKQTRTGNVLLRRDIIAGDPAPFRREFGNGGEDDDFFRRMMARGHCFVWCNEAVVHEVVPPERCTLAYHLNRALLRGQNQALVLRPSSLLRSMIAAPAYAVMLPFALLGGRHVATGLLVRFMDHIGKLCGAVGVRPVSGRYLTGDPQPSGR